MPKTNLTLEETNVILILFYKNTTKETSVRKMAMLFRNDFSVDISRIALTPVHLIGLLIFGPEFGQYCIMVELTAADRSRRFPSSEILIFSFESIPHV